MRTEPKAPSSKKEYQYVYKNSKGKTRFPSNIPIERTGASYKYMFVTSITLIIVSISLVEWNLLFPVIVLPSIVLLLSIIEVVKRVCHCIEEFNYLNSRYGGNIGTLLSHVFAFNKRTIIILASCCMVLIGPIVHYKSYPIEVHHNIDVIAIVLNFAGVYLIYPTLQLADCSLNDSLQIKEMKGLDYGSGMAYSFFHGYLKIVLPTAGTGDRGLKHLMENYEVKERVEFVTYKLYILVPLSLYCPERLASKHSPSMQMATTLESIIIDVAGVTNRVYKNSVYKIQMDKCDKMIYVCAEYATPLRTFFEFMNNNKNREDSEYCQTHTKDILWQFYTTTTKLIREDPSTTDLCELIYYDDKDSSGSFIDVGPVIVEKLIREKRQKEKKNK